MSFRKFLVEYPAIIAGFYDPHVTVSIFITDLNQAQTRDSNNSIPLGVCRMIVDLQHIPDPFRIAFTSYQCLCREVKTTIDRVIRYLRHTSCIFGKAALPRLSDWDDKVSLLCRSGLRLHRT